MRCPYCNYADSRVADSRPDLENGTIRRRRVCNQCGAKFTTVERIQMRDLIVRKNSGKTEPFDRDKLRRSIKLACHNRDVGDEQIERLVASIQRRLETENVDDRSYGITHIKRVPFSSWGKGFHTEHVIGDRGAIHPKLYAKAYQLGKVTVFRGN